MLRFLRYIVEIFAALVGVAIICGCLLAWRLSSKPVSADFMTPYIVAGIESAVPDSKVKLKSSLLTWDGGDRVLSLHVQDIDISDAHGEVIATIPFFDTKMSMLGLFFGQFIPKELSIDHPQIRLERSAAGVFAFGGKTFGGPAGGGDSTGDAFVSSLAKHLTRASFMRRLAVTRAVVDIHDLGAQRTWSVSIPEISVRRNALGDYDPELAYGALDGRIKIEVAQKDAEASLDVRYGYDPSTRNHTLTAVFDNLIPARIAGGNPEALGMSAASAVDLPLTGRVEFVFDKKLNLLNAAAHVHGEDGFVVYPAFWDNARRVKDLALNAAYDRAAHKLSVSDTRVDFGGPVLAVTVEGLPSAQKGQDIDYAATLKLEKLPMNKYGDYWPKSVLPNPREWMAANMRDGMYDLAEVTLKGAFAFGDLQNLSVAEGGGKVAASGARVTYIEGMPPVEGVGALATFDLKRMDIQITGGGIGNIRLAPFTIAITGLADVDQYIDIPMNVSGPLPEILRLLDHPPMGYAKALGLAPDELMGKIAGQVKLQFPLLKSLSMKDVIIRANAQATAVASTKLLPGIPFDQGNLELTLDNDGFGLKGPVALGKAPFDVTWQENFEATKDKPFRTVKAVGSVSAEQWKNLGVSAFDGTKGPINATFEMAALSKTKRTLSGTLDMTAAALVVPKLNWKKAANLPAVLTFTADVNDGRPIDVSSIVLRGARVSAKGKAQLSPDMSQVLSLTLDPFVVGRTNASLRFSEELGKNGKQHVEVKGASFDISGLGEEEEAEVKAPRPQDYSLKVDRFYTGEKGEIDKVQGTAVRDALGWKQIDFRGLADGDMPLSIELRPQIDGTSTFSIMCDDFGKAMKGFGFADTIRKGRLLVVGKSETDAPRVIKGRIKIVNFTVEKLPILALLLNATSPFGFAGIFTDSTDFSRLKGEFVWDGDQITLTRANAAGSAYGININGKIDLNASSLDLQGTIVPFSVMNDVLNRIPLLGDLITGGKDQGVLAVAYKIDGDLDAPHVSVNPVSLLTPGFIRNLFFRDEDADEPDEAKDEPGVGPASNKKD